MSASCVVFAVGVFLVGMGLGALLGGASVGELLDFDDEDEDDE